MNRDEVEEPAKNSDEEDNEIAVESRLSLTSQNSRESFKTDHSGPNDEETPVHGVEGEGFIQGEGKSPDNEIRTLSGLINEEFYGEGDEEDAYRLELEREAEEEARKKLRLDQCQILVGKAKDRHELVDEYLRLKAELKYEEKKNAFLQDRIYKTSVRKGIIDESKVKEEAKNRRRSDNIRIILRRKLLALRILKRQTQKILKRREKKLKKKAEKMKQKTGKEHYQKHRKHLSRSHSRHRKHRHQTKGQDEKINNLQQTSDDDGLENREGNHRKCKHNHSSDSSKDDKHHRHHSSKEYQHTSRQHKHLKKEKALKETKYQTLSVSKNVPRSIKVKHLKRLNKVQPEKKGERESKGQEYEFEKTTPAVFIQGRGKLGERINNEFKYDQLLHKVIAHLRKERKYAFYHDNNLKRQAAKRDLWGKAHEQKLKEILKIIKAYSEEAIDSNTGFRIPRSETDQFCKDIATIHKKLCNTMVAMFKSRRGLELSLKRLEASEVQGEGLQMLEYEQLRSENQTLKDRLGDRVKDVENIKDKITHAIQILAHFRNKMYSMNQQIADGKTLLSKVNTEVYAAREKIERMSRRHEKVKREEQSLIVESGLLDNATLLRDYERTHFEVTDLKEQKRKLTLELENYNQEIKEIKRRINEMRVHYPDMFAHQEELGKAKQSARKKKKHAKFQTMC